MAVLRCRECQTEISSNTRQTRCKGCGTLFPFACAICEKSLRPPFSIFPEERFLTSDNQPLCEDHYQRQCPDCQAWFRADENPGYFRCPDCTSERARQPVAAYSVSASNGNVQTLTAPVSTASYADSDEMADEVDGSAPDAGPAQRKRAGCALNVLALVGLGASVFELGRHLLHG